MLALIVLAIKYITKGHHIERYNNNEGENFDEGLTYIGTHWYLSCGHEYESVEYLNYCPVCGRKVVDNEL